MILSHKKKRGRSGMTNLTKTKIVLSALVGIALLLASAAPPAVAAPKEGEQAATEIKILGLPMGYTGYTLSFGLTSIINKYSKKLHATFESGSGTYANQQYIVSKPESARNTIIFTNQVAIWMAEQAWPPLTKPYLDFRCITKSVTNPNTIVTLNPQIKTLENLTGKRVALGPKASSIWVQPLIILEYLGLKDKINLSAMSFGTVKDALLTGSVDAGFLAFTDMGDNKVVPIPATDELVRTKTTYIISTPPDVVHGTEKKTGAWLGVDKWSLPAMGPTPAQQFWGVVAANGWWCHKDMPEAIVEEVLTVLYEHIDEMGTYDVSGKAMTRGTMAKLPLPEDKFSPTAVKFYKKKGIKVGWTTPKM
jgi:uncharacterized protein